MKIIRPLGLILVAAMLSAGPALATTYDAVTGFNATSNVAGNVWTYRAGTSGEPLLPTAGTTETSGGLNDWSNSGSAGFPNQAWVVDNPNGSIVGNSCCTSIQYHPNALSLDGQSVGSIVRFAAPTGGAYSVTGLFESNDTYMAQHNVGVVANIGGTNNTLWSQSLAYGATSSASFSNLLVTLAAGDYVDFISYGFGGGSYGNTGLQATLTTASASPASVPEPTSLLLLAVGLIGLVGIERWYRRAR